MADVAENPDFSQEQWREMKTRYNKAKDLLDNIIDLHSKFESAQVNLKASQSEVEKISNEVRDRFNTIENAKNDSATFISDIKSNLEKVQSSIVLLNDGLAQFEGIKGKIQGKDGEIENLVSTANNLKADIEKTKADAQKKFDAISDLFTKVQEKITEMENAYTTFIEIRGKIRDGNTGLEAILSQAQNLNTQSQTVFAEIKSYRDQSQKYLEEIEQNKNSTDVLTGEINENLSRAKGKVLEVEKITALITDTGFANSFQKREKMLRWSSGLWLTILIAAIYFLVKLLMFLFAEYFNGAKEIPEMPVLLLRLTLTSPLLFIIGIATHNYGKERDLNERYAFKATIAEVMRSHSDFLIETDKKTSPENTAFIRNTIKSIYAEPFEGGLDMKKVNKELASILEKNTDKKTKILDIVSKVKELKEIIPDEVLLKNIIDIFIKFK